MSHTVKLNGSHWKTIKAIWRQTAHPFVLITRSPGLSSFRRARHWDVFGIIFLMLQQPVQQKNTTDYSQRVSWLSSIYCDTLLYFSPPFLPLLFLPSLPPPPPPLPLLSPSPSFPSSSPLPSPLQMLFLCSTGMKMDEKLKQLHTCSPSIRLQGLCCVVCVCCRTSGADGALYVCQLFVCASLCAAGNSKTRPYRPPRGLKAQGVPKQHGLNRKKKKKAFQMP